MTKTTTDRIEKQVLLKAPRARVWKALTDSREFGEWFGVAFDGPFVPGQPLRGTIVPTKADPEVARAQQPYAGTPFHIIVEQMEPQRLFSFRWHPFAIDPQTDYTAEPTTLVVFTLEEHPGGELHEGNMKVAGGVLLKVTESGFDRVPLERRAQAFSANEGGWAIQMTLIEKYLAQTP